MEVQIYSKLPLAFSFEIVQRFARFFMKIDKTFFKFLVYPIHFQKANKINTFELIFWVFRHLHEKICKDIFILGVNIFSIVYWTLKKVNLLKRLCPLSKISQTNLVNWFKMFIQIVKTTCSLFWIGASIWQLIALNQSNGCQSSTFYLWVFYSYDSIWVP